MMSTHLHAPRTSAWRALTVSVLLAPLALAAPQFPALSGRVVDQAGLLPPSGRAWLEQRLAEHERTTGNQVVVVTLSSLQGYAIEDYAVQLGRHWGIGQAQKNNGVVLLIAPKERALHIAVGYGLEGQLTDAASHAIIQNEMLPYFKRRDYETGIIRGASAVLATLEGSYVAPAGGRATRKSADKNDDLWLQMIFVAMVLLFLGTRLARFGAAALGGIASGHFAKIFGAPLLLAVGLGGVVFAVIAIIAARTARHRPSGGGWGSGGWGGGGYGGGGGYSSGGGFSGGGGSFGGGGASGRW